MEFSGKLSLGMIMKGFVDLAKKIYNVVLEFHDLVDY